MKTLVIAEKPSVAADIAKALGRIPKKGDHYEDEQWVISSAIGHLVCLCEPEDIDKKKYRFWTLEALPIVPESFSLKVIEDTKDRFDQLKKLIARKDVGTLINACDAGREGELIFRYISDLSGNNKPVKRLWLSSMTPTAIRSGFDKLREAKELDLLGDAAMCRSESDWLIGMNGTRAITKRLYGAQKGSSARKVAPVGRVQTPTLAMMVEREKAIKAFLSQDYWEVVGKFDVEQGSYEGKWFDESFKKVAAEGKEDASSHLKADRLWSEDKAEAIRAKCLGKIGTVEEVKKPSSQSSPLLLDLTSLQREANKRFGFPASRTLQFAQSLYERHKMITYPRTDSKCLPEDYVPTVREVLGRFPAGYQLAPHAAKVLSQGWVKPNKRVFNNAKVSDHFAIIPTGEFSSAISPEEEKIFQLICRHFVAVFFPPAVFELTTRITRVEKEAFKTEGKILRDPGWLAVYGREEQGEDLQVPPVREGEKAETSEVVVSALQTRPPARFNEATLLSAMEGAGKLVEDEELQDAMKERGLGTPATRAAIIDKLIKDGYIIREGRDLSATAKGIYLIEWLQKMKIEEITSPALTGGWEHKLNQMEDGQFTRAAFMREIVRLTTDMVTKVKGFEEIAEEAEPLEGVFSPDGKPMVETMKTYQTADGTFKVWKIIAGRKIERDEVRDLLAKKMIGPLPGFISARTRKTFNASLRLDEAGEVKLVFDNAAVGADGKKLDLATLEPLAACPMCGSNIYETALGYICEKTTLETPTCKFKVSKKICGREMTSAEVRKLISEGKTNLLEKFWSPRTRRPFSAFLKLDTVKGWTFDFPPRAPKVPKGGGEGDSAAPKKTTTRAGTKKTATKTSAKKKED